MLKRNEARRVRDIVSFTMHHHCTPSPLYVYRLCSLSHDPPTTSGCLAASYPYLLFKLSTNSTYFSSASVGVTPSSTIFCQARFLALPWLSQEKSALRSACHRDNFVERSGWTNLKVECTWVGSLIYGRILSGLLVERIELRRPHVSVGIF
jgi:hypothetical protein